MADFSRKTFCARLGLSELPTFRGRSPSHLKYICDRPKSMHVVDMAIVTLRGTITSTDIRLRLTMPSDD
jgi:hypothetical protein